MTTKLQRAATSRLIHKRMVLQRRLLASDVGWWAAGRSGRQPLLCIGDSHLKAAKLLAARGDLPGTTLRIFAVGGATASGAVNPNGRSGANQVFEMGLARAPRGTAVLICLGEIDAGFLVFVKAAAAPEGGDPRTLTLEAARRYQGFISDEVLARGLRPLVLSATYPTVESYVGWAGLGGARRTVTASRVERAGTTQLWNEVMAGWCAEHDVSWLDLGPATTDGTSVRSHFVDPNPEDHHYAVEPHAALLASLLRQHGFD